MKHEDEHVRPHLARTARGADDGHGLTGAKTLKSTRELPEAVNSCRRCELWRTATQGVPGEGKAPSGLMLVGEAPGDSEDLQGHPFVGPAGAMLDRALQEAGMNRNTVYVTNAVKHFKFEPRGKRRLHMKPSDTKLPYRSGLRSRNTNQLLRSCAKASRSKVAVNTASPSSAASATFAPVASAMNDDP